MAETSKSMYEYIEMYSPLKLSEKQLSQLAKIGMMLKETNKSINLTALKTDDDIALLHFADSLTLYMTEKLNDGANVIDVGCGAGFPSLPLAVYNDKISFTLLDSTLKKLEAAARFAQAAELSNVVTLYGRAEELAQKSEYRKKYDIAVSRGVARLNILCEWCMPYVKVGGYFLAMKGKDTAEELKEAESAIRILGGVKETVIQPNLPGKASEHKIVVIKKISDTPNIYPRRNSMIAKKPL